MKSILLSFVLLLTPVIVQMGCKASNPERSFTVKPTVRGRAVEADPDLKQFLISHGFHLERERIYAREYFSLREAGKSLGFSISELSIPVNGPPLEIRDERVIMLRRWGFTVLAIKGRTLDDLNTPCTVSTSLIQVQ